MTDPTPTSRRFALIRDVDHTGVSGTGFVAEGVEFQDGTCSIRWNGDHRSTVNWDSLDDAIAVHRHAGATRVHWFDDENGVQINPVQRRLDAMNAAHSVLWAGGDNPDTLRTSEVVALAEWLMHGNTLDHRRMQDSVNTTIDRMVRAGAKPAPF